MSQVPANSAGFARQTPTRPARRARTLCGALALGAAAAAGDYATRPDVAEYMDQLASAHGFDRYWLQGVFATARKNDDVLAKISRPAERALKWHEYRRIFIKDARIRQGAAFWRDHANVIDRAAADFRVRAEILVAVIGVETYYGRVMGSHSVMNALATLAFDFPRRAKFFRGELTEFLLLVREEAGDPFAYKGSYAGAMGYGQFIPSSYRSFAVDFDGDGKRDIWRNIPDAVGSVANYFARHGWRDTGPVAVRVGLADPALDGLANQGLDLKHTVGALRERGLTGADALSADAKAALYRMETERGVEHWLGLHDFHVITRYNRSAMYALAVLQLSEAIEQAWSAAKAAPQP